MGDVVKYLGYGCTNDVVQCKDILSLLHPLNEITISKILGAIASSCLYTDMPARSKNLFHECTENEFDELLADIEKEMSMGDVVKYLGYGCTDDATQCKEILSLFQRLNDLLL
ncbi:hypothetical protein K2173_015732 [Erythroxylum novogranatense]|uniref:Uncharacterized protein n=1 Tax=Erythroxylum novogranatense TaxID=1862640 RepID=A0AAV8SEY7_9ROSI|nr:hypothetical protein K2173_015732 [Erythroxylum novogranatense]